MALGHFGDDDSARKLTRSFARGRGSGASKSCEWLDGLAEIGSDVALMDASWHFAEAQIQGPPRASAQKMDEVAEKLGLTAGELEDRLVPDLDLEDDGSKTLDFGRALSGWASMKP